MISTKSASHGSSQAGRCRGRAGAGQPGCHENLKGRGPAPPSTVSGLGHRVRQVTVAIMIVLPDSPGPVRASNDPGPAGRRSLGCRPPAERRAAERPGPQARAVTARPGAAAAAASASHRTLECQRACRPSDGTDSPADRALRTFPSLDDRGGGFPARASPRRQA
jgi:hypothetical protein